MSMIEGKLILDQLYSMFEGRLTENEANHKVSWDVYNAVVLNKEKQSCLAEIQMRKNIDSLKQINSSLKKPKIHSLFNKNSSYMEIKNDHSEDEDEVDCKKSNT